MHDSSKAQISLACLMLWAFCRMTAVKTRGVWNSNGKGKDLAIAQKIFNETFCQFFPEEPSTVVGVVEQYASICVARGHHLQCFLRGEYLDYHASDLHTRSNPILNQLQWEHKRANLPQHQEQEAPKE